MNREEKHELVTELRTTFGEAGTVVVAHYTGMTVKELESLRGKVRESGASFRVTKNRLTRLALEGTKFDGLSDLFTGPTGIAVSRDPVAAAKVIVDFAKTNDKLVILGGAMQGKVLGIDGIKALAALPSLNTLRAGLLGLISTPATRIAGILQQPGASVARVLSAYASKSEAVTDEAA